MTVKLTKPLTFIVSILGCATATACNPTNEPQVTNPVPDVATIDPLTDLLVKVVHVASLPDSGTSSRSSARPMTLVGDGQNRRFVADQNGIIYRLHSDDITSVYLNLKEVGNAALNNIIAFDFTYDTFQKGLSSIAFHPDFANSGSLGYGKFYTVSSHGNGVKSLVDYPIVEAISTSHYSVLHEWHVDPNTDVFDYTQTRTKLVVEQPYVDHNVGQISFNPNINDGLLYITMADGGSAGDPLNKSQDLTSPLGKLLRIDPNPGSNGYLNPATNPFVSKTDGSLGEIYAYGLRNPHRFCHDTGGNGSLLVSDIGQRYIEEVNIIDIGGNYGWREREGTFQFCASDQMIYDLPVTDNLHNFIYPVLQYDHDENDRAISGGYVYRGNAIPSLQGQYIFGDLVSGRIFYQDVTVLESIHSSTSNPPDTNFRQLRLIDGGDGQEKNLLQIIADTLQISTPRADLRFGIDDDEEVYFVTKRGGSIWKLTSPFCATNTDCEGSTFCGPLVCNAEGLCEAGASPCSVGQVCVEEVSTCTEPSAFACMINNCGCEPFLNSWCDADSHQVSSDWCRESESHCKRCSGVWCGSNSAALKLTAEPTRSFIPSKIPTLQPSSGPSSLPSQVPTLQPSEEPTEEPTGQPTTHPTQLPTNKPSSQPSSSPMSNPTARPTSSAAPSVAPSAEPSRFPTQEPTTQPSTYPSRGPTGQPAPTNNNKGVCVLNDCGCDFTGRSWCDPAQHFIVSPWCKLSESNCKRCNGVWCGPIP